MSAGQHPPADTAAVALDERLRAVAQGDAVSIGAVSILSRGDDDLVEAARGARDARRDMWVVTVRADVGWYVVCSQDCDIVRSVDVEPCVSVAPLMELAPARWRELRRGPGSPRLFPFPSGRLGDHDDEREVAVDLRWLTTVDKRALAGDDVEVRRPLSAPQRRAFGAWIGQRFARAAFDDDLQRLVLDPMAARLRELAKKASAAQPSDTARVVGATVEWYVVAADGLVDLKAVLTEPSTKAAGLWDHDANEMRRDLIEPAVDTLRADLRKRVAAEGHVVRLEPVTYEQVSLAEYLAGWTRWVWERSPDPLA